MRHSENVPVRMWLGVASAAVAVVAVVASIIMDGVQSGTDSSIAPALAAYLAGAAALFAAAVLASSPHRSAPVRVAAVLVGGAGIVLTALQVAAESGPGGANIAAGLIRLVAIIALLGGFVLAIHALRVDRG